MNSRLNRLTLFIDRALSNSFATQIAVLAGVLVVSISTSFLLLSFSGSDWIAFCNKQELNPWLLPVYLVIDTNALNALYMGGHVHGWMLFTCSITYLTGLFVFNGMVIGIITNAISDRVQRHRNGLLHYVKNDHYIIMGYDDMVSSIILNIFAKSPDTDIILLTSQNTKYVNENIGRSVDACQMKHIFVTYGHRMVNDSYKSIHLETAKEVYIVGNRNHHEHDSINVECVNCIGDYLNKISPEKRKLKRIICVFEDTDTYVAFRTTEIFLHIWSNLKIEFIPYNYYVGWARKIFVSKSYKDRDGITEVCYPSIYGKGVIPQDKKYVHLVFIGISDFSVSLAIEAAQILHFPNFEKDNTLKTRITFIDPHAREKLQSFALRNRHFFEIQPYIFKENSDCTKSDSYRYDWVSDILQETGFLDTEFEFINGEFSNIHTQNYIKKLASEDNCYLSIFTTMDDSKDNFFIGMNLPDEVYNTSTPIFVKQNRTDDFITNLRNADNKDITYYHVCKANQSLRGEKRKKRYANIYPFGMNDMAYYEDNAMLNRAKLLNYLYCKIKNNHFPPLHELSENEKIWYEVQKMWEKTTIANKWSNMYAAYNIQCKLDTLQAMHEESTNKKHNGEIEISEEETRLLAAVEHNRWNVEKLLMGYRKAKDTEDIYIYPQYSKELNTNKKNLFIHHDIRPFNELNEIKYLDFEFVRYIPWILKMTNTTKD